MYNIGDIVTVHNSIDADDVKYLNHTGIIQEIHKKDEYIYGIRFNAFSSHVDRYFYDSQIRLVTFEEVYDAYLKVMQTHMN